MLAFSCDSAFIFSLRICQFWKKKMTTVTAICISIKLFTSPIMKGNQKYTRICILPFGRPTGGGVHFVALAQSSPMTNGAIFAQLQHSLLLQFSAWVDYTKKKGWLLMGVCTHTNTHTYPDRGTHLPSYQDGGNGSHKLQDWNVGTERTAKWRHEQWGKSLWGKRPVQYSTVTSLRPETPS